MYFYIIELYHNQRLGINLEAILIARSFMISSLPPRSTPDLDYLIFFSNPSPTPDLVYDIPPVS